jgi:hypothetical protein
MSRDLSEKQKTLDRQKLLGDEQGFIRSRYARAMAIDALRAKSSDMKTKGVGTAGPAVSTSEVRCRHSADDSVGDRHHRWWHGSGSP